MSQSSQYTVQLSDGETIMVEACVPEGQEVEVGFASRTFQKTFQKIKTFSEDLKSSLQQASPDKVKVEFGVAFSVEASGLSALIANGSGQTNLKITLEWDQSAKNG